MSKNWQDYGAMTAALASGADDLLTRDKSDTTDHATEGTVRRLAWEALLAASGLTPGGRLTLESGVPISTSNQTAKGTLYYTPYVHDYVRLYDGTRPKLYTFTERSLSLTVTSGKNHDVFLYDNSGTLTLELSAAWTNDTTRADALAWQSGVGYVKSGTATRLWLGTIRASGTNTTEQSFVTTDAPVKQFVWNAFNRVRVGLFCHDSTDSWTYTTATWRRKRASANNQIEVVCGQDGVSLLDLRNMGSSHNSSGQVSMIYGIGIDATDALATGCSSADCYSGISSYIVSVHRAALLSYLAALGYHYAAAIEYSDALGTTTWVGDGGAPKNFKNALHGVWEC